MSNNRINNNDEVMLFMQLEPLVRVYFAPEGNAAKEQLAYEINKKLDALDELRGYKFDTKASAEQFLAENKYEMPLEPVDIIPPKY
jgi:hypothetical protein